MIQMHLNHDFSCSNLIHKFDLICESVLVPSGFYALGRNLFNFMGTKLKLLFGPLFRSFFRWLINTNSAPLQRIVGYTNSAKPCILYLFFRQSKR